MSTDGADLAVVGAPFLDLTFAGLPTLPRPTEEILASALVTSPGGTGATAIAAARLGLSTVLVAPVPGDAAGAYLRAAFDHEGVRWTGPAAPAAAVTAVLSSGDGTAMATYHPDERLAPDDVASARAGTVIASLARLALAPRGPRVIAVTGPGEVGRFAGTPGVIGAATTLICNEREALLLTGCDDLDGALGALTEHAADVVVTRGQAGAVMSYDGTTFEERAPVVDVVDATGAGDAFVAAYAWASVHGAAPADRLAWATLYATVAVTFLGATAGAGSLDDLLTEGRGRGLTPPLTRP